MELLKAAINPLSSESILLLIIRAFIFIYSKNSHTWETLFIGTFNSVWERLKHFLEQSYRTQVSKAHGLESSSFVSWKFNIETSCFELGFYIILRIAMFYLHKATESGGTLVEARGQAAQMLKLFPE